MAGLQPIEVEKWLSGLGSLLPREAVLALTQEVRRESLDGERFGALVASRSTPALGDAVRPTHMATLRRCWNANHGSCRRPPSRSEPQKLPSEPRQRASNDAGSGGAVPKFAPPPRRAAEGRAEALQGDRAEPRSPEVSRGTQPERVPSVASPSRSQSAPVAKRSGEATARAARPPIVPKLDLSFIHNANSRADAMQLNSRHWVKPAATDAQPQGLVQKHGARGFACANSEDKQRIADYYGYRDYGFAAAMNGLGTDQIRPRLYVGTMADAAYWPHLKSLSITHVVNCAVESQKVPPPYESHGITYYFLPLHDTADEVQHLARQRYRSIRNATRFIRDALRQRASSVLLHCVQGLSRSAAVACAYLMEYEDVMVDRAIAEMQAKHQGCLTAPQWQSLLVKLNMELLKGT